MPFFQLILVCAQLASTISGLTILYIAYQSSGSFWIFLGLLTWLTCGMLYLFAMLLLRWVRWWWKPPTRFSQLSTTASWDDVRPIGSESM